MNETLKVIKNRRSIRKYTTAQISDAELREILDCSIYAPNAMNLQSWHFTVIQNKNLLDRMAGTIKENIINLNVAPLLKMAQAPGYHTFYNAPTVIMISADEKVQLAQIDGGTAAQTIALAAESLNIGSCVMTSPGLLFAAESGKAWKQELGIPEGYSHICSVALGYKDGENPPAPPKNKNVVNFVK